MHSQEQEDLPKLTNVLANWQNRLGRPPKKSKNVKTLTFHPSSTTRSVTRTKPNRIGNQFKQNISWNKFLQQKQFTSLVTNISDSKENISEDIYKAAFYSFPISVQIVIF